MEIIQFKLGDIQSNCYIVRIDKECFIVDPGFESDQVSNYIKANRLEPQFIYITHGHFDHVGGVKQLKELYHIPVYAPLKDKIWMQNSIYNRYLYEIPVDQWVVEGDKIEFKNQSFKVLELPGHSAGSSAIYLYPYIFSGDLIFAGGYGRYDLPFSSKADLINSIKLLFELPEEVIIYPGHGNPTTIEHEKKTNPINIELVKK